MSRGRVGGLRWPGSAGFDDVGLDDEVVADEVGWVGVVGEDAAYFGGGEDDVFGAFLWRRRRGLHRR